MKRGEERRGEDANHCRAPEQAAASYSSVTQEKEERNEEEKKAEWEESHILSSSSVFSFMAQSETSGLYTYLRRAVVSLVPLHQRTKHQHRNTHIHRLQTHSFVVSGSSGNRPPTSDAPP